MFDISMSELLVIGVIALLIVGPKDLPKLMRQVSQWLGAARRMAGEFRRHVDDLMRETELEELRREVNALRNPKNLMLGMEPKPQSTPATASQLPEPTAPPAAAVAPEPLSSKEGPAT
jgi:sec-independent protein translocase protein TatB